MSSLLIINVTRPEHSTPPATRRLARLTAIGTSAPGTLRSIARVTDLPGRPHRSAEFTSTI
ncbi:hypothetical protein [Streptomyces capitiformicae]|uniref:hypothetical protein n=1 Tax=Streptomyces capitiformicae TaxID=2014920 RepID=UPI0016772189|nr:hypothetical protein [Streptomyces capitiformicae]